MTTPHAPQGKSPSWSPSKRYSTVKATFWPQPSYTSMVSSSQACAPQGAPRNSWESRGLQSAHFPWSEWASSGTWIVEWSWKTVSSRNNPRMACFYSKSGWIWGLQGKPYMLSKKTAVWLTISQVKIRIDLTFGEGLSESIWVKLAHISLGNKLQPGRLPWIWHKRSLVKKSSSTVRNNSDL